jgi:hypothetical protein
MPVLGSEPGLLRYIVHETHIYTVAEWQKVTLSFVNALRTISLLLGSFTAVSAWLKQPPGIYGMEDALP